MHPIHETPLTIEAPIPADMQALLELLRQQSRMPAKKVKRRKR
jgi:hypothetical protein